jgi:predicted metalloprotease with PDZ domain
VELKTASTATNNSKTDTNLVQVSINLNDVKEDKVLVTITAPKNNHEDVTYIPKIVPGTYSIDDYGKYIEEFKAFDSKGIALIVTKTDDNTWNIKNAKSLAKLPIW